MSHPVDQFKPGEKVVVTQQIAQRDRVWSTKLEGEVVRYEQQKTGSWFAHSRHDKLWLDRLIIKKADGEIVVCNLDAYTHVEALDDTPAAPVAAAPAAEDAEEDAE